MKRKLLAVGVIILFVGSCSIPAIVQGTEKQSLSTRGSWLYVGGSGPGNYSKIQDAVNNASNGDTIYVFPGTYREHILLSKGISLQGADPSITIIDGQGMDTDIVTCVGSDAIISCFTIYNCSMNHSCILVNHTSNCTLQENIIHTAGYGVTVRKSQNISIVHNTLLISQNIITYTDRGITDEMNSLPQTNKHLIIDRNQLDHNRGGIFLAGSKDYSITQNEISNSTVVGIYLLEDIYVSASPENISIKENVITTSAQGIVSENAINMSIEGNSIRRNNLGLSFAYDSYTSVTRNIFLDNNKTVVYYWAFFSRSSIHNKVPRFDMNFWDRTQKAPYPVIGRWSIGKTSPIYNPLNILPWVTFDWHPAQGPKISLL